MNNIKQLILNHINNKKKFMYESNFSSVLIDNIVYFNIILDNINPEIKNGIDNIINNFSNKNNSDLSVLTQNSQEYLTINGFAFKTSKIETNYNISYYNDKRSYSFLSKKDSNIEVSFLENSQLTIKKIFKYIRDEMLYSGKYYNNDLVVDIEFYIPDFKDDDEITIEKYYGCLPTEIEGHMFDSRKTDINLKMTDVTFVWNDYKLENK